MTAARFATLSLLVAAAPARAADTDAFRYRGTDIELGGAWMIARVEDSYPPFEAGQLAWGVSPFVGIGARVGWSNVQLAVEAWTAPLLAYPVTDYDYSDEVPADFALAVHPVVAVWRVAVGPYLAGGLGNSGAGWYTGIGAKASLSLGDCGWARGLGISARWTVRETLGAVPHDFALAIRYRIEPADLRAEHACP